MRRYFGWASIALLASAIICWGAYQMIGSQVDAEGILREPFALIPLSWFFLLGALVAGIISAFIRRREHLTRQSTQQIIGDGPLLILKKHIKFALIILFTVITTSLITTYYAAKNTRTGFLAASLDMEAFNELHRIRSWDSLEQLLTKGCNKEALEYVQMEQALHLLSLQESLKNGAKLDESEKAENQSIISRANTIVNKGKYYIPSCY